MRLNKDLAKFTRKHLCYIEFHFNNEPAALLKKRLQHRCFPVNFAKFAIFCESTLVFISTFYFEFNFLDQFVAIRILSLEI